MTTTDTRAEVLSILTEAAPDIEVASLDPDADLYEAVGIDSMDLLNVAEGIDDRLGVKVSERDYPKLTTVNAMVAHLESLLAAT